MNPAIESPYPGLRPFEIHEADIFFGRETDVNQLLKKLEARRFIVVVGPSGCGKSSLVRAGLIPALRALDNWRIAAMCPGDSPHQ